MMKPAVQDTERDRLEAALEALRASEEFKTRLIASSRDCIKVLDLEGRLLSMNAGGMEVLEICDLGPFLHTSWIDFWQGEDRERARAAVATARQGRVGRFIGYFPTTQTHTPLWFDVVVNAILNADGQPEQLLALSRDVTDLKRAEEILRNSHDELERTVQARTVELEQANAALHLEVAERKLAEATLRSIVKGVEADTGDKFFGALARHLAEALEVQYAFVSELSDDRQRFRTRAVWGRGAFLENLDIPVAGTPCEAVLRGEMSHHPDHIQELFPDDTGLVTWGVVSYSGVPLIDSSSTVVGHLAILHDKPMVDGPRGISIMRIFAARACAELQRLQVEAVLRDSEARYRDLYDEAPVAYLSFDIDGHLLKWNRRALELLGYDAQDLTGRPFVDFAADTPNGKQRCRELYQQFLDGIETLSELEGVRPDGSTYWVRASVRPIRDAAGRIVASRSILADITDRKRMEQALEESEQRLSRILESAMDAIVTVDDQERIILFNDAAEKVFGCSRLAALGQPLDRFLTEGFRHALDRSLQALESGDRVQPYVWAPDGLTARSADGHEFPIEATISRVEVGGRTLHTLILRDVDERRRAQEAVHQLNLQKEYLQEEIKSVHNFEEIVGQSGVLVQILDKVKLVASTDSTVLILGETGTGKELIARAIHSNSGRRDRPLIKVNCAALPSGLIESELFGHEKGAFTGAMERRIGRFELANGGTIFLDEIGEMPPEVQVKLLRVLQEHEFERVGGRHTIKVDVRIIAATNRDLAKAVADGGFRQDLYYRLNVFPVPLPPLRQRPEDIPLLVHYFVRRYAAKIGRSINHVSKEEMRRLLTYPWPGNVRELENVIERAVILSPGPDLTVGTELLAAAPAPTSTSVAVAAVASNSDGEPAGLEDMERTHIVEVLKRTGWRIDGAQGAARILKINPSTLRSRMQKLGIRRSPLEHS